jgi:hypothetical protein
VPVRFDAGDVLVVRRRDAGDATRDIARSCNVSHNTISCPARRRDGASLQVSIDIASLAPNAEITAFPGRIRPS